MLRILTVSSPFLLGTQAAPTCTSELCCTGRYGFCADNTHAAPVGSADPVAYSASQILSNYGDVACGTGYKDKTDKASISGTDVATCCDAKTCSDLTCANSNKMAKSSPTQPSAGNEPSVSDCCEDITGMCSGNTASSSDVACGTGYKDKTNKATITGTDVATCCDPNQLCTGNPGSDGDISCPSGFSNKGQSFTYDRFGTDDTNAEKYAKCCQQPKCTANVASVAGTCAADSVSSVTGTCNLLLYYTEVSGIASLPADPSDWSNPGSAKDVSVGSNLVDCCTPTTGMCSANTASSSNVACGTGYKDKTNKAAIAGTDVAACCDAKTCSDLTCANSNKMAKSSPTQPSAGNEPSVSDCCEDITGMCSGNTASSSDVACGTGYKDKTNKATITGTDVATCCDAKTCSDLTCANSNKRAKSSPTQPSAGNEPSVSDCCEDITDMCAGNTASSSDVVCNSANYYTDKAGKTSIAGTTVAECCDPILNRCLSASQAGVEFSCGTGLVAQELSSVSSIACTSPVDCVNDYFDVTGVTPRLAYGPECPDPVAQATAESTCTAGGGSGSGSGTGTGTTGSGQAGAYGMELGMGSVLLLSATQLLMLA